MSPSIDTNMPDIYIKNSTLFSPIKIDSTLSIILPEPYVFKNVTFSKFDLRLIEWNYRNKYVEFCGFQNISRVKHWLKANQKVFNNRSTNSATLHSLPPPSLLCNSNKYLFSYFKEWANHDKGLWL